MSAFSFDTRCESTDIHTYRQTDRQTYRQTDRQTYRQTDRQTDMTEIIYHAASRVVSNKYFNMLHVRDVVDDALRRKRTRNRWYKTVTLVNNPSLVFERLMKLYQQEMDSAVGDEDETFRIKVITICDAKKSVHFPIVQCIKSSE